MKQETGRRFTKSIMVEKQTHELVKEYAGLLDIEMGELIGILVKAIEKVQPVKTASERITYRSN